MTSEQKVIISLVKIVGHIIKHLVNKHNVKVSSESLIAAKVLYEEMGTQ